FPPSLRAILQGPIFYLDGGKQSSLLRFARIAAEGMLSAEGLEIDGKEISCLKVHQIKDAVASIRRANVGTVAIVGIFSPLDHEGIQEEACKKMMLELDPTLSIVCSHSIGGVGLLERENAAILN